MAENTNERVIVGFFDDYAAAQQVSRELANEGVPEGNIHIESNMRTGAAGYGGGERREEHEGGFAGWWHSLFGSSSDSDNDRGYYSEGIRRGGTVLSVTVPESMAEQTVRIMNENGAVDIDRRAEAWRGEGYTSHNPNAAPYTSEQASQERSRYSGGDNATAIPVVDEELQVGKRAVQRGGVRIYSRVTNRPVEEQITLREEHVRVERRPVDRELNEADLGRLRDQTIEVTEIVEEPVISKRARVKEEVVVNKEATEHTETVRDNVRRSDVQVEQLNGGRGAETGEDSCYNYGYTAARDDRYRNQSWDQAETSLRDDYMRQHPGSTWDEIKDRVRRGWEKVTGSRQTS